jgi:hypothetical protein
MYWAEMMGQAHHDLIELDSGFSPLLRLKFNEHIEISPALFLVLPFSYLWF